MALDATACAVFRCEEEELALEVVGGACQASTETIRQTLDIEWTLKVFEHFSSELGGNGRIIRMKQFATGYSWYCYFQYQVRRASILADLGSSRRGKSGSRRAKRFAKFWEGADQNLNPI